MIKRMMASLLVFAMPPAMAAPGDIEQLHRNDFAQVKFFAPAGQTFTAERPRYSRLLVGFLDCNSATGDPLLRLRLRSGAGADGVLLREDVAGYATGTDGWLTFDVSTVAFAVGQVYTAEFVSASTRGCLHLNNLQPGPALPPAAPDYIGGSVMLSGFPDGPYGDLQFRLLLDDAVFADGFD
jgi:hypothetical protein